MKPIDYLTPEQQQNFKALCRYRKENGTQKGCPKEYLEANRMYRRYCEMVSPLKTHFTKLKRNAKRRGLEFTIAFDYFRNLVLSTKFCPVFGWELDYSKGFKEGVLPNSMSIDRIDSTKGYIEGNIQVLSYRANTLKWDATLEELEKVVKFLQINQQDKYDN